MPIEKQDQLTFVKPGARQILKNFVIGGLSGMIATSIIQPADMLKTRIQLASEARVNCKPGFVASKIFQNEGIKGYYAGLDAALARQAIYCGVRLGVYFNMAEWYKREKTSGGKLSIGQKAWCSLCAGILASTFCTPMSLILTRMQADSTLPPPFRRNYRHVFDAVGQIYKKEGVLKLWTGGQIVMMRSCSMNVGMMVTYDEGKERLAHYLPNNVKTAELMSSLIAAFVIGVGSLPFDNVKTKLQKQYKDTKGVRQYSGIADCFGKTIANEGFRALWVGLPAFYLRVGPHAVITLHAAEMLRKQMGA